MLAKLCKLIFKNKPVYDHIGFQVIELRKLQTGVKNGICIFINKKDTPYYIPFKERDWKFHVSPGYSRTIYWIRTPFFKIERDNSQFWIGGYVLQLRIVFK